MLTQPVEVGHNRKRECEQSSSGGIVDRFGRLMGKQGCGVKVLEVLCVAWRYFYAHVNFTNHPRKEGIQRIAGPLISIVVEQS